MALFSIEAVMVRFASRSVIFPSHENAMKFMCRVLHGLVTFACTLCNRLI
jgi:hypothetical protein